MLKQGKLSSEQLEGILINLPHIRSEVITRPSLGEDCATLRLKDNICVISCDPITAATENAGEIAVHVACNDIAAAGSVPIALMVTLLVPTTATLSDIERVMQDMSRTATSVGVEIIGGHTEITDAVNRIVISSAVIGVPVKKLPIDTKGACIGDALIMTKYAGIEGTAIIINDYTNKLHNIINENEQNTAQNLLKDISVIPEGIICAEHNANAMHDATEGGILGAAYEMACAAGIGVKINIDEIPVLDITIKLCDYLQIDPYRLISSGCMLISAVNGKEVVQALQDAGIQAAIIGKFTKQDKIYIKNGVTNELEAPEKDELYKAMAKLS